MIETNKTFFMQHSFGAGRLPGRSYCESEFSSAGGYHTHISVNRRLSIAPPGFGGAPSGVG
jgi:hypothetical protein